MFLNVWNLFVLFFSFGLHFNACFSRPGVSDDAVGIVTTCCWWWCFCSCFVCVCLFWLFLCCFCGLLLFVLESTQEKCIIDDWPPVSISHLVLPGWNVSIDLHYSQQLYRVTLTFAVSRWYLAFYKANKTTAASNANKYPLLNRMSRASMEIL